ncbi:MAG: hypothetical protein M3263_03980 [Thermoproteota archaeon]|jgi:hypothetical protein|nr:hypothetical protein [Thermoproteota archaeon]
MWADLKIEYELLNSVCDDVLAKHNSIRWTGVVNKNGVILAQKSGKGVKLLLSDEENEEYAATAIARQKTRGKFEPKIGKMIYSFGRYELLQRATVPINENYYLLITLTVEEKNFDSIILDKILPVVTRARSRLVTTEDSV